MKLEERLSRAKDYYDGIQIDSIAFEKRVLTGISEGNKINIKFRRRFNRVLIGVMAPLVTIGAIVGIAPTATANTVLSFEQISSKVFSLNYTHPINGYVVIDGIKLTSEQYKMLFTKAVWTKNGYTVTTVPHVDVEVQQGQSVEYPTLQQATEAAHISMEAPTFVPKNVESVQYYAVPGYSLSIWYQYSDNRQIYLTVYSSPMTEVLDNVRKVRIGDKWATIGETPQVYADKGGTIQAKANYVLDYVSSRGIQYRIAGNGFSESDLITVMQSVPTP